MKCKHEHCDNNVRPPYRHYKYYQCSTCATTKHRYGITKDQRENLLQSQNSQCKICKKLVDFKGGSRAVVDHIADTKTVRGILCDNCNKGIGLLYHSEEILKSAIKYLRRSK